MHCSNWSEHFEKDALQNLEWTLWTLWALSSTSFLPPLLLGGWWLHLIWLKRKYLAHTSSDDHPVIHNIYKSIFSLHFNFIGKFKHYQHKEHLQCNLFHIFTVFSAGSTRAGVLVALRTSTLGTCDFWDISSEWWGDMTWPKKGNDK